MAVSCLLCQDVGVAFSIEACLLSVRWDVYERARVVPKCGVVSCRYEW